MSIRAAHVVVEAVQLGRRLVGSRLAPELRPEPRYEVDAADGRARLAQPRYGSHEIRPASSCAELELEVRMRRRSEREDAALRRVHDAIFARGVSRAPGRQARHDAGYMHPPEEGPWPERWRC